MAARPEWGPPWALAQLASADEVEALDGPPGGHDLMVAWAWIDEDAGTLRARAFPVRIGIAEDEATGSAATKLCARGPADRDPPGPRVAHPRPPAGTDSWRSAAAASWTTCATTRCPERGSGTDRRRVRPHDHGVGHRDDLVGREAAASACARIASGLSAA